MPQGLLWSRADGESGERTSRQRAPRPLICMTSWMQAQPKHVAVYQALFHRNGWDVLCLLPPTLAMWRPHQALHLATTLLEELLQEIGASGPRPIVFVSFSGGAKAAYYRLLQLLAGGPSSAGGPEAARARFAPVRRCVCGQVFDSSPIDFISKLGVRFLSPPGPPSWQGAAWRGAAVGLDLVLGPSWEGQRQDFWRSLESFPDVALPQSPSLILCSEDDPLAPAWRIRKFAAALAARSGCRLRDDALLGGGAADGGPGGGSGGGGGSSPPAEEASAPPPSASAPPQQPRVRVACWASSEHVAHFRRHPLEYEAAVASLLRAAADAFGAAHGHAGIDGVVAPGVSACDGRGAGGYLVPGGTAPLSQAAAEAMLASPLPPPPPAVAAPAPAAASAVHTPYAPSSLDGVLAPGAGARRDGAGVARYMVPGAEATGVELDGVVLPGMGPQWDGRGVGGYLIPSGAIPETSFEAAKQLLASGAALRAAAAGQPPTPQQPASGGGEEFARVLIAEGQRELMTSVTETEAEASVRLSAVAGGTAAVPPGGGGAEDLLQADGEAAQSTLAVMRGLMSRL